MKTIFFLAIIAMALCSTNSAKAQVIPQNITSSFSLKYPTAKAEKWTFSKDIYSVCFTSDNKKSIAYFNTNGNWIKTETKIRWTWKLPSDMQVAFKNSGYKPWYIEDIKQVNAPDGNAYVFTVDNRVMLDGDHMDAFFSKYKLYFSHDSLIKKEMAD